MPNVKDWKGPKSVCSCGHYGDGTNSHHEDRYGLAICGGHGKCTYPGCTCEMFTWERWTDPFKDALDAERVAKARKAVGR